jgi:hypothetical protein
MAVGGLLPAAGQVPIVGDVVVVEDHIDGQMRECPLHARKAAPEPLDHGVLGGVAGGQLRRQRPRRPLGI